MPLLWRIREIEGVVLHLEALGEKKGRERWERVRILALGIVRDAAEGHRERDTEMKVIRS